MRLDSRYGAWFLSLVVTGTVLSAARPAVSFVEPDGFGKAKFGMTEERVKAFYPKMESTTKLGPDGQPPLGLTNYKLEKQAIGPLRDCSAEFQFLNHELYAVEFRCLPKDKEKAFDWLSKRFGTPTQVGSKSMSWTGKKSGITFVPSLVGFKFIDLARNNALGLSLMSYVKSHPESVAPRAAPPQAAAPQAATPAAPSGGAPPAESAPEAPAAPAAQP